MQIVILHKKVMKRTSFRYKLMKVKALSFVAIFFTYFLWFSIEFFQLKQHKTPIRFVFRICTNLSCVTQKYSRTVVSLDSYICLFMRKNIIYLNISSTSCFWDYYISNDRKSVMLVEISRKFGITLQYRSYGIEL